MLKVWLNKNRRVSAGKVNSRNASKQIIEHMHSIDEEKDKKDSSKGSTCIGSTLAEKGNGA